MIKPKKKKTDRDQFVGVKVSKEVKLAIIKEAEKRDTSMSRIVVEVLTKAFEKNGSVQTSSTRN